MNTGDEYRPVEEPFGPDEPDFTDEVDEGAEVDEAPDDSDEERE